VRSVPFSLPITEQFVLLGTNFTKADTATRSQFAITKPMAEELYQKASTINLKDFFIISTCNRTEFYACASEDVIKKLVSDHLQLQERDIDQYFYLLTGIDAVRHFFRVVAGLDSQIVGDYEIVCQVRSSLDEARKYGMVGTLSDRISNFAFQASKKIKAHTNLSSGKYSVSYAAAELMFHLREKSVNKILLIGTGDFGSTVARNLRHYFPHVQLSVSNRTLQKAEKLAGQVKANLIPFESFKMVLNDFDVIITTVGLENYLIHPHDVTGGEDKLFLDLSVPQAINPEIKSIPGVTLYSVDEISRFHNELLAQRKLEIPRAEKIAELYTEQFMEWAELYNYRHVILTYKQKIQNLLSDTQILHEERSQYDFSKTIEKTFSGLIQQFKVQGYAGCSMIEAFNNLVPEER